MSVKRKIILGFLIILLIGSTSGLVITTSYVNKTNADIKNIDKKMKDYKNNIEVVKNQNNENINAINNLKDENKDKMEEQEIWLEMKEKINQAL